MHVPVGGGTGSLAGLLASRGFSSAAYYSLFPYLLVLMTGSFHLNLWMSGLVVAAMLSVGRLLAIPAGYIVDRQGPRFVVIVSNVASAAAMLALIEIPASKPSLVIGILLFRAAIGSGQSVAYQVLTFRHFDEQRLVKGYGYLGMAANVGVVLGPVATSVAGATSILALLVPFSFHTLSVLSALFVNGECAHQAPIAEVEGSSIVSSPVQGMRLGKGFLFAYAAQWFLLQQVVLSFAYYCTKVMSDDHLAGVFFGLQGLLIIPTLYLAAPRLTHISGRSRPIVFIAGCVLLAVSFLLFGGLSRDLPLFAVVAFALVLTASEALSVPLGDAHIASSGNIEALGLHFSVVSFVQSLGVTLGSVAGTALMWALEREHSADWFWQIFGAVGLAIFVPLLVQARRGQLRSQDGFQPVAP